MKRHWWQLTNEELARLNPPPNVLALGNDGNWYILDQYHEGWQPVGCIPEPRTRLGWFMYHLIHGLVMRYPWWKVLGFAFASTKPEVIDLADPEAAAAAGIEFLEEATPVDVRRNLL